MYAVCFQIAPGRKLPERRKLAQSAYIANRNFWVTNSSSSAKQNISKILQKLLLKKQNIVSADEPFEAL
jgi:hypothetical protein